MQSLVKPNLPGTPATPAEEQLWSHLNGLSALHEIHTVARRSAFLDDLTPDLRQAIEDQDLLWNESDGSLALAEAAEEAAREWALDIQGTGQWSLLYRSEYPEYSGAIIQICTGGPAVDITLDVDPRHGPNWESAQGQLYWAGTPAQTVDIPNDYHEALDWYWALVAA